MNISELLSDNDWDNAFCYAESEFSSDDVSDVIACDEGYNDGDSWVAIFLLNNGKFAYLNAWCDFTGWGCRSDGDVVIRDDLRTLVLNDVSEVDRVRLGFDRLTGERLVQL